MLWPGAHHLYITSSRTTSVDLMSNDIPSVDIVDSELLGIENVYVIRTYSIQLSSKFRGVLDKPNVMSLKRLSTKLDVYPCSLFFS